MSATQLLSVYYGLVESRLRYGIGLWGASPVAARVFVAQKKILRCIFGFRHDQSCRSLFLNSGVMTLTAILIFELCMYAYKNRDRFQTTADIHGYGVRCQKHFRLPAPTCDIVKRSPLYLSQKLFNALPHDIRDSTASGDLKKSLKLLLTQNVFYSLEEFFAFN